MPLTRQPRDTASACSGTAQGTYKFLRLDGHPIEDDDVRHKSHYAERNPRAREPSLIIFYFPCPGSAIAGAQICR